LDLSSTALRPGSKVSVTFTHGEVVEGYVHCKDPAMNILMLRIALTHTTLSSELRLVHMDAVSKLEIDADGSEPPKIVKAVTKKTLEKREYQALSNCSSLMTELNDQATPEGQAVFDALHKTLDCRWVDKTSITVLEQVNIVPPYKPENCKSLDGDKGALDRIVKIVSAARVKAATPATPAVPPGFVA